MNVLAFRMRVVERAGCEEEIKQRGCGCDIRQRCEWGYTEAGGQTTVWYDDDQREREGLKVGRQYQV